MDRLLAAILLAVLFAMASPAHAGSVSIGTLPASGDVAGAAGTVVGWGFTLSDTTSDWVVLNDSFFTGSTTYGSYVDYLSLSNAPLYVAGPSPESTTISQAFNPSSNPPLGLGEFDLDLFIPPGTVITGDIGVDYTLFSEDPNSPSFDPDSFVATGQLFAPVTITVATPEPASGFLMLCGMAALTRAGWRRKAPARG